MIKKWIIALAAFTSVSSIHALENVPCSSNYLCLTLPADGWTGHVDLLYWKTRKCGLDYLWPADITRFNTICDGTPSIMTPTKIEGEVKSVGKGKPKVIDLDYDLGFRCALFKRCDCWDAGLRYTYYSTDKSSSFHVKNIPYRPSRQHPDIKGFVDGTNIILGKSSYDLELNQLDWEVKRQLGTSCDTTVAFVGGLKMAFIDQDLKTTYKGLSLPKDEMVEKRFHTVSEKVDMDAYGLYIGAEAEWHYNSCWTVFGRFSIGSLLANFDRSFFEKEFTNPEVMDPLFEPEVLVDVSEDMWCGVSQCEFSVGLDYLFCRTDCSDWHLQLGYEFLQWNDMRTFMQFTDHHEKGSIVRVTDNLEFDGLYLRLLAYY